MPLKNIRVVLLRPRGAANVGAVARAMKNMGLDDLVLVRPALVRAFWSKAMAVHAEDVLRRVRRCDSLGEAVADCGLVVGTTCRGGLYRGAAEPLRQAAPRIIAAASANRVALIFGPEDNGLGNEDLKRCQQLTVIPADPGYPSLNLAQAVMVCGYELFLAASSTTAPPQVLASAERIEMMFQRLQAAFLSIGYLHRDNPDHIMFAFRRLLGRAQMEERDVRILLALARQIEWFGREGWRKVAAGASPHADETVDKREPHPLRQSSGQASRRSQKKGPPQDERKLFCEDNNRTARPEEPPPEERSVSKGSGGVSKGARW